MTRLHIRAAALADLDAIWLHIAADDLGAADKLIDDFDERCRQLTPYPRSGPSRPEINPRVRTLGFGRYLIFYIVGEDQIDVVRVVHGARDLGMLDLAD